MEYIFDEEWFLPSFLYCKQTPSSACRWLFGDALDVPSSLGVARGKFQGKWLSIFWSVRYAPDNFSLPHFEHQIRQRKKKHQFLSCFCVSCVTLFSERGSLVVKTTLTEHFFRWGFCEKFLSQGLSAALKTAIKLPSKHKFAQRGSETTKRISLFYIFQNIWSYWHKDNINSNCITVIYFLLKQIFVLFA